MSGAYTADGRRRSSMTHAKRGHQCQFCPKVAFGNGGAVSHARSHVNRGEAIELVKHYAIYPPMLNRTFIAVSDIERVSRYRAEGYEVVSR